MTNNTEALTLRLITRIEHNKKYGPTWDIPLLEEAAQRIAELEAKLKTAQKWENVEAREYEKVCAERDALQRKLTVYEQESNIVVEETPEGIRWLKRVYNPHSQPRPS